MSDQEKEKDAKGVPLDKWANDGDPTDEARQKGYDESMKDETDDLLAEIDDILAGAKESAPSK